MAQLVVRELEDNVKRRLQQRAKLHGRSMEEEIRCILRDAVKTPDRSRAMLGSRIAARFRNNGLNHDLPEFRGQAARPAAVKT
ncbi:MAG: Arc family DNA-binding protein [Steroidobacteraceae bacterium]